MYLLAGLQLAIHIHNAAVNADSAWYVMRTALLCSTPLATANMFTVSHGNALHAPFILHAAPLRIALEP